MKPEEIIQYLEMVRPAENYSHTFPIPVGNTRHFGHGSQLNKDVSTAIDLAIQALEKQVPKKLKIESIGSVCPECFYDTVFMSKNEEYCPRCGQKLDMSW